MQTANLENCKRLYELSGWDDTDYSFGYMKGKTAIVGERGTEHAFDDPHSAYDSGYLLRKLPPHADLTKVEAGKIYYAVHHQEYDFQADNPEDALCLLAIKLFEEGILK